MEVTVDRKHLRYAMLTDAQPLSLKSAGERGKAFLIVWACATMRLPTRGGPGESKETETIRQGSDKPSLPGTRTTGYEADLWRMADTLRGSMDAAEYKHVVLGLIFLKYISDAFEENTPDSKASGHQGADPEDPDDTAPKTSSGYHQRSAGRISRPRQGSPPSAN